MKTKIIIILIVGWCVAAGVAAWGVAYWLDRLFPGGQGWWLP